MKVKVLVYDCLTKEIREEEQEIQPVITEEQTTEQSP